MAIGPETSLCTTDAQGSVCHPDSKCPASYLHLHRYLKSPAPLMLEAHRMNTLEKRVRIAAGQSLIFEATSLSLLFFSATFASKIWIQQYQIRSITVFTE